MSIKKIKTIGTSLDALDMAQAVSSLKGVPYLISLTGSNAGWRYNIQEKTIIGRDPSCDIHVTATDISRQHAKITRLDDGYQLEDLGSHNGTFVNGTRIKTRRLIVSDTIQFGASSLYFFTLYSPLDERLMEERTLESVARLAGGIAHDFNNIMAAILIDVDFLQEAYGKINGDNQDFWDGLENIQAAATKASHLVSQLLGFARKGKYESQFVNFSAMIEDMVPLLHKTSEANITIRAEVEPNLVVYGDTEQLHQVLMNVCFNARDAMPLGGELILRGSKVELTSSRSFPILSVPMGQYILLEVEDTGVGIKPEDQKKIFEPFFTTKDPGKGSGLGLATVYGVVKNHGGYVEVKSEENTGTTFLIYLPASEILSTEASSAPTDVGLPAIQSTVLVIEDEPKERKLIRRMLETLGYHVIEASDGREAIKIFSEHKDTIKVVLLDMILPHLSGTETYRWLKRIDARVGIVLTSGYLDEERVRQAFKEGVSTFLAKPFKPEDLDRAIATTIGTLQNINKVKS